MTDDEIRAAVQADQRLLRLAVAGNAGAIAAVLAASAGRVQVGAVLTPRSAAALFPAVGGLPGPLALEATMIALEDYAALHAGSAIQRERVLARGIKRMLDAFTTLGLDFGHSTLRDTLDALALDVLSADQVAALKSLAGSAPAQLTARQVVSAIGRVLPAAPAESPRWL